MTRQLHVERTHAGEEEAQTAFANEHGLLIADPDHSEDEDRFLLLGAYPIQPAVETMRKQYDFSQAKPNPYASTTQERGQAST